MWYRDYIKRMLDISLALVFLMLFSWLFLSVWLAYALTWNFPVIYRQQRTGWRMAPFTLYKFRTLKGADSAPLASRNFLLGKWLRRTSLDELPQLWNVLVGDMSLVGPRPLPVAYVPLYSERQARRHDVRPGITGWAQVNGKNSLSWPAKFEYDLAYVDHCSFWLDLRIVVRTVLLLLSFQKDVSLEEEKFKGN